MQKWLFLVMLSVFLVGCSLQEELASDTGSVEETAVSEEISSPLNAEERIFEEESKREEPAVEVFKPGCIREFIPALFSGPHYQGDLFDAHFHMPNLISPSEIPEGHGGQRQNGHGSSVADPVLGRNVELDKILCNFEMENVKGAIGFVIGDESVLDKTISRSRDINARSNKINLFLMPAGFSTSALENIQQSNRGLFKGYGEMAFYDPSYAGVPPDSTKVMKIYEVAERNSLIVMIHPAGMQKAQVENAVRKNPEVKFLIHGPEAEEYIINLMDKYQNVYYSIDAILIRFPNFPGALMYSVNSKEEFVTKFSQNFDVILDGSIDEWKEKIEKYPNRFMWGTDRSPSWTYDEDVSALIEEFARSFIGRLDPAVQEKYAYKNAEALLEK